MSRFQGCDDPCKSTLGGRTALGKDVVMCSVISR